MRRRRFLALLGGTMTFPFGLMGNAPMARGHSESLLADQFRQYGYVYVPSLIPESKAKVLENATRSLPGRRVICGNPNVSWEEQAVPENHDLYDFFLSEPVKAIVARLLNTSATFHHLTCWVSRYRQNEYIGPHKDRAGTLQIVLSLNRSGEGNGGALNLVVEGETIALHLNPGDALFFRATAITHCTTPVIATAHCLDPIRVVGVGRYFFAEN